MIDTVGVLLQQWYDSCGGGGDAVMVMVLGRWFGSFLVQLLVF